MDFNNQSPGIKPHYMLKDFTAGLMAGVGICLIGHPFDTIKINTFLTYAVRMQVTENINISNIQMFIRSISKEGLLSVYKGMSSPLLTSPFINAIVFTSYHYMQNLIVAHQSSQNKKLSNKDLSLFQISLCGSFAGLVNSFVVSPVELIKARLQVNYNKGFTISPFYLISDIMKKNGIKGLYQGMFATILREVPCYFCQFYLYEGIKRFFASKQQCKPSQLSLLYLLIAGSFAGIAAWLPVYPQDIIKTRLQVAPYRYYIGSKRFSFSGGFFNCFLELFKKTGYMGFFRGLGPCLLRAIPSNAVGFLLYELTLRIWNRLSSSI